MSLSSVELNYLIWRYLQEGGLELAAYALQKESSCLDYEHMSNKLVSQIGPGSLVSLVQKGILYTFLEDVSNGKSPRLSLADAVVRETEELAANASRGANGLAPSGVAANGVLDGSASVQTDSTKSAVAGGPAAEVGETAAESDEMQVDQGFETREISAALTTAPSLCLSWNPFTNAVVVGHDDSLADILTIQDGAISEAVKLVHPPVLQGQSAVPNSIMCVSWAPQGSMVLTAGSTGELRAWTSDGRLKNIVNVAETGKVPASVSQLSWNFRGSLVLAVDMANTVSIYEGVSLGLVSELRGHDTEVHACWISDHKFAVTTDKKQIQIFSVNGGDLVPAGTLAGHDHVIGCLTFSSVSKLLASSSDVDYAIRVWNSQSSHEALELNVAAEKLPDLEYHSAPIVCLAWLSRATDIEGNLLLSVSMEGTVNLWDAFTGDALISANIFKNPENFRYTSESHVTISTKNALVYAAAASPDSAYLAIGDDSGAVSIWDIQPRHQKLGVLRCLGVFSPGRLDDDCGICDLAWNKTGDLLCVGYKGGDSVMIHWQSKS